MTWTRLRQVALVAHDLDAVVRDLHDAFALEVAFNDPGVATFGLRNAVLPIGTGPDDGTNGPAAAPEVEHCVGGTRSTVPVCCTPGGTN